MITENTGELIRIGRAVAGRSGAFNIHLRGSNRVHSRAFCLFSGAVWDHLVGVLPRRHSEQFDMRCAGRGHCEEGV